MAQGTLEEIEIEPATEPRVLAEGIRTDGIREDVIREDTLVRQRRPRRPLPLWVRVVVLLVGWVVLLVGVAGLVLPGIQGVLTILLGAAILSVASELAHKWIHQLLQRWPKLLHRIDNFRDKIYDRLHRMVHRE